MSYLVTGRMLITSAGLTLIYRADSGIQFQKVLGTVYFGSVMNLPPCKHIRGSAIFFTSMIPPITLFIPQFHAI